ncbi:MAG: hypothetical protein AAGA18_15480 [Verrucomicrobiota bacterium]
MKGGKLIKNGVEAGVDVATKAATKQAQKATVDKAADAGEAAAKNSATKAAKSSPLSTANPKARSGEVGMDNNALINAMEGDGAAKAALGGRTPVVSPQAVKEFATGSKTQRETLGSAGTRRENVGKLREFLKENNGRVGVGSTPQGRLELQSRGIKIDDSAVIDSGRRSGVKTLTRDKKLLKKAPDETEKF